MSSCKDRRLPPPSCQCEKWSGYNPCQMDCTQEDLFCDVCRASCGFILLSTDPERYVHIVPLKIQELSRMFYGRQP